MHMTGIEELCWLKSMYGTSQIYKYMYVFINGKKKVVSVRRQYGSP